MKHPLRKREMTAVIPASTWVVILMFVTTVGWGWYGARMPFPYIFADETGFMIPARAVADANFHPDGHGAAYALRSQSPVHSLAYSVVFGSGDGFFAHAKLINCLLCGLTILPAFLIARRVASLGISLGFATLVALNPWNSLTAHFMAEPLYCFLFWWLALAFLASLTEPEETGWQRAIWGAAGCGLIGVVLFFTKPHALMLLAACGGGFFLRSLRGWFAHHPRWWLGLVQGATFAGVAIGGLAAFAAAAHRTLADVIFAGRYQTQAGDIFSMQKLALQLEGMWRQTAGHLGHAAVLYAIPLAVIICVAVRAVGASQAGQEKFADMVAFVGLAFGLTLAVTIKFACDIMLTVDPNDIHRLAERYYGFMLPLLALPVLAAPELARSWTARILAVVICGGAAVLLLTQRDWYQLNAHDAPQFYWLSRAAQEVSAGAWLLPLAITVAVLHLIYFVVTRRYDWRAFAVLALMVSIVAGTRDAQRKWLDSRSAIHFHAFSLMSRQLMEADWARTIVVGDPAMVSIYLFYLDGLPKTVILRAGAALPADRIPAGTKWIIRLREHALPAGLKSERVFHYQGNGVFDISRISP
jgi:hypothetical protein